MSELIHYKQKPVVWGVIYWTPRILSILFLCFLAMFSLDVFEEGRSAGQIALGLLMHNIPVFILLAVLIIAWKREIVGAVAFALGGFLYIGLIARNAIIGQFEWYMLVWSLQIAGPAFFIAYLFWLNWRQRKNINAK